jgi:hypothetical protein
MVANMREPAETGQSRICKAQWLAGTGSNMQVFSKKDDGGQGFKGPGINSGCRRWAMKVARCTHAWQNNQPDVSGTGVWREESCTLWMGANTAHIRAFSEYCVIRPKGLPIQLDEPDPNGRISWRSDKQMRMVAYFIIHYLPWHAWR